MRPIVTKSQIPLRYLYLANQLASWTVRELVYDLLASWTA